MPNKRIIFIIILCICLFSFYKNEKSYKILFYSYDSVTKEKEVLDFLISLDNLSQNNTHSFYDNQTNNSTSLTNNIPTKEELYLNSGFTKRCHYVDGYLNYPARSNVKLKVYINGEEHNASGTLISEDKVLTAGHVIFVNNKWVDSIIVIPSYNHGKLSKRFKSSKSTRYYIFKSFVDDKNFKYDVGILKLDRKLGNKAGYMGIGFKKDVSFFMKNNTFHHFSYPSKSIIKGQEKLYNGNDLYYNYGNFDIYKAKNDWIRYKQSSPKGESGSSFFYLKNNKATIYGVLSLANSTFILITPEKFYSLKNIIENY